MIVTLMREASHVGQSQCETFLWSRSAGSEGHQESSASLPWASQLSSASEDRATDQKLRSCHLETLCGYE